MDTHDLRAKIDGLESERNRSAEPLLDRRTDDGLSTATDMRRPWG